MIYYKQYASFNLFVQYITILYNPSKNQNNIHNSKEQNSQYYKCYEDKVIIIQVVHKSSYFY